MTQKIFLPFEPTITVVDFARKGAFVVIVVIVVIVVVVVVIIIVGPFCSHKSVFKGCGIGSHLLSSCSSPFLSATRYGYSIGLSN
jgi:hypothetical protein